MAWAAGCAGNSSFKLHKAQRTVACPVSFAIVTRTASSPHRGQMNTVGSFFFTIRITRRLLLPNLHSSIRSGGQESIFTFGRGLLSLIHRAQRQILESVRGVNFRCLSIDSLNLAFVRQATYVAIALQRGQPNGLGALGSRRVAFVVALAFRKRLSAFLTWRNALLQVLSMFATRIRISSSMAVRLI